MHISFSDSLIPFEELGVSLCELPVFLEELDEFFFHSSFDEDRL